MLSVPGLMVPVTALPSQSRIKRMLSPCTLLPVHSPIHEPFRGCPSCASAPPTANAPRTRATTNVRNDFMLRLCSTATQETDRERRHLFAILAPRVRFAGPGERVLAAAAPHRGAAGRLGLEHLHVRTHGLHALPAID